MRHQGAAGVPRIWIAAALGAAFSCAAPAAAHEWIEANDFRNASGVLCCNRVVLSGTRSDGTLVEVWRSEAGGTFTVTITYGAGFTCLLAAGEWVEAPAAAERGS